MSYFSQMAGLAVQNFVSAAVGMAVLVAVIRGFAAPCQRALGNFWQDLDAHAALHPAPALVRRRAAPRLAGRDPDPRRLRTFTTLDRRRPDARARPGGLAGSRSSSSAPTAAASSTSTARCRSRTPPGSRTSSRCSFILLIPAALTATFGRMVGNRRQGWALYAAMLRCSSSRVGVAYAAEQHGSPARAASRARWHGRRTSRARSSASGSPSTALGDRARPSPPTASVNSAHDSLHRHRRRRAAGQHDDRRGHLRRRRLGPLRDAAVGPARRLHRRPDGRAHAGVPRQEDRGARGQARADRDAFRAARRAGRSPALAWRPSGARRRSTTPGPQGFSETLYAYTSQGNNNGSAFAGYTGFVQPNAPGNVGAFGITFADLLGGFAMLAGRFVPLLAALAVAGVAGRRSGSRPLGPGTFRTDTPDVRGPPDLRDRDRRRAHLLPRPPARPDRPGPDHPALLTCAET